MISIGHVEIVVPARDEQDHIGACLRSLVHAIAHLEVEVPTVSAGITVVLDSCADRTEDIAANFGVSVLTSDAPGVGAARRAGVAEAINRAAGAGIGADAVWIACTDADTVVPQSWLTRQLALAAGGLEAVIGTVTPTDVSPQVYRRWLDHHDLVEGHHHVHGANLGFRADVYLRAGGFLETEKREDVGLVERIRALTPRWVATHQTSVRTSGRTESRVEGGFASFVAGLGAGAT